MADRPTTCNLVKQVEHDRKAFDDYCYEAAQEAFERVRSGDAKTYTYEELCERTEQRRKLRDQ